jgi:hypothetical protein
VLPASLRVAGYLMAITVLTMGYAIFQAANNTAVMTTARADERGVVAGVLSLSRNVGLIAGASLMGAVFALGAGVSDVTTAPASSIARGMRVTFALASALLTAAMLFGRVRR